MNEMTLAEIQEELLALRQELGALRSSFPMSAPAEQPDTMERLRQQLQEKGRQNGITISHSISQIRGDGGNGTASYSVTLNESSDLPTEEQITEKIANLRIFIQNPLVLRALRCLTEPHFEGRDKRRTKADLAASLAVSEAEIEATMTPLLDKYEVTWGKDKTGQEYYEWTGNGFAMLLLIAG